MQVSIKTTEEGAMTLRLDEEAAAAVLACITFASQFHATMALLARATHENLPVDYRSKDDGRSGICR